MRNVRSFATLYFMWRCINLQALKISEGPGVGGGKKWLLKMSRTEAFSFWINVKRRNAVESRPLSSKMHRFSRQKWSYFFSLFVLKHISIIMNSPKEKSSFFKENQSNSKRHLTTISAFWTKRTLLLFKGSTASSLRRHSVKLHTYKINSMFTVWLRVAYEHNDQLPSHYCRRAPTDLTLASKGLSCCSSAILLLIVASSCVLGGAGRGGWAESFSKLFQQLLKAWFFFISDLSRWHAALCC